jgi:hypothetical protein
LTDFDEFAGIALAIFLARAPVDLGPHHMERTLIDPDPDAATDAEPDRQAPHFQGPSHRSDGLEVAIPMTKAKALVQRAIAAYLRIGDLTSSCRVLRQWSVTRRPGLRRSHPMTGVGRLASP